MSLPFTALRVRAGNPFSALATGSNLIFVTENSQRFIPMFLHLEITSLSGLITTSPSMSLGTSSGGSDVMSTSVPSVSLLNSNKLYQANIMAGGTQSLAPGTSIWITVNIAAIGPTSLMFRPDILGYYL